MEQLQCTFYFEPTDDLRALDAGDEWVVGDLASGFAEIEALPVFQVIDRHTTAPLAARIEQEWA
jgi:hypothetical protein